MSEMTKQTKPPRATKAPVLPAGVKTSNRTMASLIIRFRSVVVLAVVCAIFTFASPTFLSPVNLTNLLLQTAATGMISAGIVLILLIGEVDLSAGAVSGFPAGVMGILAVNLGIPIGVSIVVSV